jgi:hypothetical protein
MFTGIEYIPWFSSLGSLSVMTFRYSLRHNNGTDVTPLVELPQLMTFRYALMNNSYWRIRDGQSRVGC